MDDRTDIGNRIKKRRGKLMSQRELADRAQVSVSLIRKLEQGSRRTASVGSLQRIARALDVSLALLLDEPAAIPSPDPAAGVLAIRRALTPVDDLLDEDLLDTGPHTLDEADRTVSYLWGQYWSGRYELLSQLLPEALARLRATVRAVPAGERARAARALARGYQAAGDTLVHLGHQDAAWLAIREGLRAAEDSHDELLAAALRVSVAWQLLVQGRYDESERVAVTAARETEPDGDVTDSALSAYGILLVTAATAAARARRSAATGDLLAEAGEVAGRLGYERSDHQTTFGPAKLAMLRVDCAVAQEDWTGALTAAEALPPDADLPLASRARHMADMALAYLRIGHPERAEATLMAMEKMAPDWIAYQSLPRQLVAEMVERERRVNEPLRKLANRLRAYPE